MTTTQNSPTAVDSGDVDADGVRVYWESRGTGGTPLVLVHGGFGLTSMFGALDRWAPDRRVIAVELEGHGHTALSGRPLSLDALGDSIAAVVREVAGGQADVLGYSLGGLSALSAAVRHPDLVRRLVLVSIPCRRSGWYPEVLAGMDQVGSAGFEGMRQSPMYSGYAAVAPVVDDFPRLMDAVGALLRTQYDYTDDVPGLAPDTMLVVADADSMPTSHVAEFFGLLGGGQRDAGWDGAGRPRHALAVVPGRTHYDILEAPVLPDLVGGFLQA
jgi:pimeloyl-ACP methyl ester carboxylesterase